MKKTASNRCQLGDKSLHATPLQSSRSCLWLFQLKQHWHTRNNQLLCNTQPQVCMGGAQRGCLVVKRKEHGRWPYVRADWTRSCELAWRISSLTHRVLSPHLTIVGRKLDIRCMWFFSSHCSPGCHQSQVLESNRKCQLIVKRMRLAQVGSSASLGYLLVGHPFKREHGQLPLQKNETPSSSWGGWWGSPGCCQNGPRWNSGHS